MIEHINTATLKKGMRVSVQHKFSKDLDLTRPGGPIEAAYQYLPGKIVDTRTITGRLEYRVDLDRPHPSGQAWFWRGVIFPEGTEPR